MTYDHEGAQTLQAGANMLVNNVTYNARGQMIILDKSGNAPDTTYAYHPLADVAGGGTGDSGYRLKTIQHGAAGTGNAFPDFTYEYDKVGNISELTTLSTAGTDTQTYTYDDLNRLLTASATGGVANYSQTYAYDKLGNMTSGPNGTYNYTTWHANCTSQPSQPLPHAVHKIGSYYFCYDNNGNMTTRSDSTGTYTQVFDVENRLTSVTPSGGSATTFAYDANGIRTKTVQPGGMTTYFPFPGYEETVNGANTIKRSSYSFAGQTVALRVSGDPVSGNNGLFYVLSDHLGSTSMLVNSSGGVVAGSTTRNLPYGGYRPGSAPTQTITDRGYTGHKQNDNLGLIYMNARYYVPTLNRFASADSIVPNPANPQSFNRYSYSYNDPINFRDPSGHNPICNQSGSVCSDGAYDDGTIWSPTKHYNAGLLIFEGDVTTKERAMGVKAADAIANRMADTVNPPRTGKGSISVDGGQMSPSEVFLKVFGGPITVRNTNKNLRIGGASVYAIASSKHALITIGNREITNHYLFIHEIFHTFDLFVLGGAANQAVLNAQNDPNLNFPNRPDLLELGLDEHDPRTWGFAGGNFSPWQKSRSGDSGEEFADMGIGWTYARWEASDLGRARADFMDVNMAEWLNAQITP